MNDWRPRDQTTRQRAILSHWKLFAFVTLGTVTVALAGSTTELFRAWYSGAEYVAFSAPGAAWSLESVVGILLGLRVAYAIALAAMLVGLWLLRRPQPQPIGRAYVACGVLLAAVASLGSWLVTAI